MQKNNFKIQKTPSELFQVTTQQHDVEAQHSA